MGPEREDTDMNETELVEKVAFDIGLRKNESKEIVEKVFELIVESLAAGDDVVITDFCSFRVKERAAKRYRHNGTGKMMEIPAGKRVKVKMADAVMSRVDPSYGLEKVEVED